MESEDSMERHDQRRAFHTWGGRFDVSRIIENLAPTIIVGLIVVFANLMVTQSQVGDIKATVARLEEKVGGQNDKLIALNAQVAAYLGQQTQLNAAIDARLTYLERSQPRR